MKRSLAKRWYDISASALPRDASRTRARDLDTFPFGRFTIDRQGVIQDWIPSAQHSQASRERAGFIGQHFFSRVGGCFAVPQFQDELYSLFLDDEFDETFFFTFRFTGEWRQTRLRMQGHPNGRIDVTVEPARRISGERGEEQRRIA